MNKLKLILTVSIAVALTLSCQLPKDENDDDGDDGSSSSRKGSSSGGNKSSSSSGGDVEIYKLVEVTDEYFTYKEESKYDWCEEGGVMEEREYIIDHEVHYQIGNKTLSWYSYSDLIEPFNFKGTSSELIGSTWTKEKGKGEDFCWPSGYYVECVDGYDYTKVVLTDTTVAITRKYCPTDVYEINSYYEEEYGVVEKILDCNTVEQTKGTDKITRTETKNGLSFKYKNITCTYEYNPPLSQKKNACKDAWDTVEENGDEPYYVSSYYNDILYKKYNECMKSIPDIFDNGDGEGEGLGKIAAKAKTAKFKPLLKKKK